MVACTSILRRDVEHRGRNLVLCKYDSCWWGRQVTGQPLTRDAVLRRLAKKMWVDYGEGK